MSGHIYALDSRVEPVRRRVMGMWGKVTPLIYTSQKRCMGRPNPKRPNWACKNVPTQVVQWKATVEGKAVTPGMVVCDDCLNRLRKMPPSNGVWAYKP